MEAAVFQLLARSTGGSTFTTPRQMMDLKSFTVPAKEKGMWFTPGRAMPGSHWRRGELSSWRRSLGNDRSFARTDYRSERIWLTSHD